MSFLLLHCRPGFEGECAAELQARAGELGVAGYCRAAAGAGHIEFHGVDGHELEGLYRGLPFRRLVFARQWWLVLARCDALPPGDRVGALVAAAAGLPAAAGELWLETPDTNEGKQLSPLCRGIRRPLEQALRQAGRLRADGSLRLMVLFAATDTALVGWALPGNSAAEPMGIPRLRFPREAPSRSTLKLEEALLYFLSDEERSRLLRPGMTAVDLGAAPGGWSWQLARRGLRVTAVDNGPMADTVMATGMVEHLRADAFGYRPGKPVEWLVCDVVEQPARIAGLIADWFARGLCRRAIFNLKLPMKKRYPELERCFAVIDRRLREAGVAYGLEARQLYHDREEVTVWLAVL